MKSRVLSIRKVELWCTVVGQVSAHLHTNLTSCAHLCQGKKRNVTGSACTALHAYVLYSGSSPCDHSCKQPALVTNSIVKPCLNFHF